MTPSDPPAARHTDLFVSWGDFHRLARALAERLGPTAPPGRPWAGIVAITRGGLVPAGLVAQALDIRLVETLGVSSYAADRTQSTMALFKLPAACGDGDGWLVIDDLADTGATFRAVRAHLPRAHCACIYVKPEGAGSADTFLVEVPQDTWIHFPWEAP